MIRFPLSVLVLAVQSCSVLESDLNVAPLSVTVSEDIAFSQLFQRCGPGWSGGDSTYSTPLSTTQVLWLFSDTFIGPVDRPGKRNPASAVFVQGNTLVLQDQTSTELTTFLRVAAGAGETTRSLPTFSRAPFDSSRCPGEKIIRQDEARAMFQPTQCAPGQHCYFWGGGMVVENQQLYSFLQRMEQTGSGIFDFTWRGTAMAMLPVEELATAAPAYTLVPNNGVSYGGAVIGEDDHYTYIYGMREEPAENAICSGHCVHIARAPKHQLAQLSAWRYWGVASSSPQHYDWIEQAEDSVPMAGKAGTVAAPRTQDQLGATRVSNCGALPACYVIIAHQYTGGAAENILAWYAVQPQGPWTGPVFVYQTPESRQPGQLFTYNAKIHPAFTNADGLLVSYDVNSLAPVSDPLSALVAADSYRPRFIRVKLRWGEPQEE